MLCIPPRDTSPHQDSAGTAPSGKPPPAAPPPTTNTGNTVPQRANPTQTSSLQETLKTGEVLCRLVNTLKPGSVKKIGSGSMPFKQMENISQYVSACSALGVPAFETFQTVDLYENKNMMAVVINLHALGRAAQRLSG